MFIYVNTKYRPLLYFSFMYKKINIYKIEIRENNNNAAIHLRAINQFLRLVYLRKIQPPIILFMYILYRKIRPSFIRSIYV